MTPTAPPPYKIGIELPYECDLWLADHKNHKEAEALGYPLSMVIRAKENIKKGPQSQLYSEPKKHKPYRLSKEAEAFIRANNDGHSAKEMCAMLAAAGLKNSRGTNYTENALRDAVKHIDSPIKFTRKQAERLKSDKKMEAFIKSLPPGLKIKDISILFRQNNMVNPLNKRPYTYNNYYRICKIHGYQITKTKTK